MDFVPDKAFKCNVKVLVNRIGWGGNDALPGLPIRNYG